MCCIICQNKESKTLQAKGNLLIPEMRNTKKEEMLNAETKNQMPLGPLPSLAFSSQKQGVSYPGIL